jgi:hypothetical protein
MLLWLGHAALDGVGNALETSVAPQPIAAAKIGSDRRADAVGTVTPSTSRPGNLTMKDLLAERDLIARCSRWYGKTGRLISSIGVNAFRRKNFR